MSSYSSPSPDQADFTLQSYSAPAQDSVDFSFGMGRSAGSFAQPLISEGLKGPLLAERHLEFRLETLEAEADSSIDWGRNADNYARAIENDSLGVIGMLARPESHVQTVLDESSYEFTTVRFPESEFSPFMSEVYKNQSVYATSYHAYVAFETDRYQARFNREADNYTDTLIATLILRGFPHWVFNGSQIPQVIEETRTWTELELVFESPQETVENVLRPEFDRPGKVDVVERIDGGFNAVDQSGGESEVQVTAPEGRELIRPIDTWYIEDYSEEPIGQDGEQWEVSVTLIPVQEKSYDNRFSTVKDRTVNREPYEWKFEFAAGDVATRHVTVDLERSPDGTTTGIELNMMLQDEEVRVMEESASALAAVNHREVPDGQDVKDDTTSDKRNRVYITPPDTEGRTVNRGPYVIDEWETFYDGSVHMVTLTVSQVAPEQDYSSGVGIGELGTTSLGE